MGILLPVERRCSNSYIDEYLQYTKPMESHQDFHIWVALTSVAVALGRKCWMNLGYFKIYPNIYVVLVGKSATARKSTALNVGRDFLYGALEDTILVFSQKITTASLVHFLAESTKERGKAEGLILASEFSVFLGQSNLDPTLIQILTDYYDCPSHTSYSTMARGVEKLENVYLTMMAGSTPEWLKTSLPENAIGGGYFSRLIIVHREGSEVKNPFGLQASDPQYIIRKDNCISDLKKIGEIEGEFTLTKEARDFYSNWYCEYLPIEQKASPSSMEGYYGRKGTTVLKLGMLISASINSSRIIDDGCVELAIKLLNENEKQALMIIQELAQSEQGKQIMRVRDLIIRGGEITHADLLRSVSHQLDRDQLRLVIDTLEESGQVQSVLEGRKKTYKWIGGGR